MEAALGERLGEATLEEMEAIWRDVRISSRLFRAKGAIQNLLGRGVRVASAMTGR